MINTLIIDDSFSCQENLKGLLRIYCPDVNIIGIGSSVEEGLQLINRTKTDLVLLDVELGNKNAFDLLNSVININFNIVFISGHEHYSLQAIKYSALDYIVKPIDPDQLIQAIEKTKNANQLDILKKQVEILMQQNSRFDKIALPSSQGLVFTKVTNIVHCESDGSYTHIRLNNQEKEILISRNLGDLEKLLPSDIFFRVHKSHLVNIQHLKEFINRDGGSVILENGNNIPIARDRKNEFLEFIKTR
jgi:two-component system LytT family response regulator